MCNLDVYFSDNLPILQSLESESISMIYIDPPFNTGKIQKRGIISYGENNTEEKDTHNQYEDSFDDYLGFLTPRLNESKRILKDNGSLFFHIDYRESHYCKILLDSIFGRKSFINEIIWSYDYGGRSKKKWSTKHDTIFWYAKNPDDYIFNYNEIERIPYMAPGLCGKEKAERGKTPTDVWWNTIVPTNGKEKTGYPTQKPRKIIDRIVSVHSNKGDTICDFFAGSGTVGESCLHLERNCILIDKNLQSIKIMKKRFENKNVNWHN